MLAENLLKRIVLKTYNNLTPQALIFPTYLQEFLVAHAPVKNLLDEHFFIRIFNLL